MIDFDLCVTLSFSGSRTRYFSFVTRYCLPMCYISLCVQFMKVVNISICSEYLAICRTLLNWLCCDIIFNACVHVKGRIYFGKNVSSLMCLSCSQRMNVSWKLETIMISGNILQSTDLQNQLIGR